MVHIVDSDHQRGPRRPAEEDLGQFLEDGAGHLGGRLGPDLSVIERREPEPLVQQPFHFILRAGRELDAAEQFHQHAEWNAVLGPRRRGGEELHARFGHAFGEGAEQGGLSGRHSAVDDDDLSAPTESFGEKVPQGGQFHFPLDQFHAVSCPGEIGCRAKAAAAAPTPNEVR